MLVVIGNKKIQLSRKAKKLVFYERNLVNIPVKDKAKIKVCFRLFLVFSLPDRKKTVGKFGKGQKTLTRTLTHTLTPFRV